MIDNIRRFSYESSILNEKYNKYIHSSGLEIYVFKKKMSTAYALLGTKYGSIHNKFNLNGEIITVPDGIAHFLEHKLFSNEDGSDSFEKFSIYGADANAYTSFNRTAYLFSCTDGFEKSLNELIDFVMHPYFTQESVDSEKGIIAEEIKMYNDNPGDRCFYGMLEGMYKCHSIKNNICGSIQSISEITPKMLYDMYSIFYRPSNMVLIVCGDVEDSLVLDIVEANLSQIPYSSLPVHKINENLHEEPIVYNSYIEQKMQVSKPLFNIAIKDVDIPQGGLERQKKDATMAILDEMLFSRAGEFYNYMFENNMISPNLSYGYTISETSAYNSIAGEADDPRAVLDELFKYIDKTKANGLSKDDFERGKRVMYAEFVKSFDSTDSIANNLFSFVCEGSELLSYAELIDSVSFDDVCNMLYKMFNKESTVLSVVLPI